MTDDSSGQQNKPDTETPESQQANELTSMSGVELERHLRERLTAKFKVERGDALGKEDESMDLADSKDANVNEKSQKTTDMEGKVSYLNQETDFKSVGHPASSCADTAHAVSAVNQTNTETSKDGKKDAQTHSSDIVDKTVDEVSDTREGKKHKKEKRKKEKKHSKHKKDKHKSDDESSDVKKRERKKKHKVDTDLDSKRDSRVSDDGQGADETETDEEKGRRHHRKKKSKSKSKDKEESKNAKASDGIHVVRSEKKDLNCNENKVKESEENASADRDGQKGNLTQTSASETECRRIVIRRYREPPKDLSSGCREASNRPQELQHNDKEKKSSDQSEGSKSSPFQSSNVTINSSNNKPDSKDNERGNSQSGEKDFITATSEIKIDEGSDVKGEHPEKKVDADNQSHREKKSCEKFADKESSSSAIVTEKTSTAGRVGSKDGNCMMDSAYAKSSERCGSDKQLGSQEVKSEDQSTKSDGNLLSNRRNIDCGNTGNQRSTGGEDEKQRSCQASEDAVRKGEGKSVAEENRDVKGDEKETVDPAKSEDTKAVANADKETRDRDKKSDERSSARRDHGVGNSSSDKNKSEVKKTDHDRHSDDSRRRKDKNDEKKSDKDRHPSSGRRGRERDEDRNESSRRSDRGRDRGSDSRNDQRYSSSRRTDKDKSDEKKEDKERHTSSSRGSKDKRDDRRNESRHSEDKRTKSDKTDEKKSRTEHRSDDRRRDRDKDHDRSEKQSERSRRDRRDDREGKSHSEIGKGEGSKRDEKDGRSADKRSSDGHRSIDNRGKEESHSKKDKDKVDEKKDSKHEGKPQEKINVKSNDKDISISEHRSHDKPSDKVCDQTKVSRTEEKAKDKITGNNEIESSDAQATENADLRSGPSAQEVEESDKTNKDMETSSRRGRIYRYRVHGSRWGPAESTENVNDQANNATTTSPKIDDKKAKFYSNFTSGGIYYPLGSINSIPNQENAVGTEQTEIMSNQDKSLLVVAGNEVQMPDKDICVLTDSVTDEKIKPVEEHSRENRDGNRKSDKNKTRDTDSERKEESRGKSDKASDRGRDSSTRRSGDRKRDEDHSDEKRKESHHSEDRKTRRDKEKASDKDSSVEKPTEGEKDSDADKQKTSYKESEAEKHRKDEKESDADKHKKREKDSDADKHKKGEKDDRRSDKTRHGDGKRKNESAEKSEKEHSSVSKEESKPKEGEQKLSKDDQKGDDRNDNRSHSRKENVSSDKADGPSSDRQESGRNEQDKHDSRRREDRHESSRKEKEKHDSRRKEKDKQDPVSTGKDKKEVENEKVSDAKQVFPQDKIGDSSIKIEASDVEDDKMKVKILPSEDQRSEPSVQAKPEPSDVIQADTSNTDTNAVTESKGLKRKSEPGDPSHDNANFEGGESVDKRRKVDHTEFEADYSHATTSVKVEESCDSAMSALAQESEPSTSRVQGGQTYSDTVTKAIMDDLEEYVLESTNFSDYTSSQSGDAGAQESNKGGRGLVLKSRLNIGITASSLQRIAGNQQVANDSLTIIKKSAFPTSSQNVIGTIPKVSPSSIEPANDVRPRSSEAESFEDFTKAVGSLVSALREESEISAEKAAEVPPSSPRVSTKPEEQEEEQKADVEMDSSKSEKHASEKSRHSSRGGRRHGRSKRKRSRSRSRSRDRSRRKRRKRRRRSSRSPDSSSPSSSSRRRRRGGDRRRRSRSGSRRGGGSRRRRRRERSRSTSRSSPSAKRRAAEVRLGIDRKKLRRIAILNMLRSIRPGLTSMTGLGQDDIKRFEAGGVAMDELQEICKELSAKQESLRAKGAAEHVVEAAMLTDEEEVEECRAKAKLESADRAGRDRSKKSKGSDRCAFTISQVTPLPSEQIMKREQLLEMFPVSSGIRHQTTDETEEPPEKPEVPPKPKTQNPRAAYDVSPVSSQDSSASTLGAFTGKVELVPLSQKELTAGIQPWLKKNQFNTAAPVTSSIGQELLKRMGWREGEGLGKNRDGQLQPVQVDIKVDRKGLSSVGETIAKKPQPLVPAGQGKEAAAFHALGQPDKHPVSVLLEYSNRRHWCPPLYQLVYETGPSHAKNFLMSVTVNGHTILPKAPSRSKKEAKLAAADAAVEQFGLKIY